ncbi:MAG: septum formation inhibitor Maf [Gammaproteobacteria bacterium]|nr:septum formation inhibitor Maf [Gammaproteobacteria bacterium]
MTEIICLASGSPRRQELLQQIGVAFELIGAAVDERLHAGEAPAHYVARLARAKALAGAAQASYAQRTVLGADTAVAIGDRILGKPRDRSEAEMFLGLLSGTCHQVYSAVAVTSPSYCGVLVSQSNVHFRVISARERAAYCAGEEPWDKAGGYAIQGLAAIFAEHLEGSYSAVMGLPLYETAQLLREAGVAVLT